MDQTNRYKKATGRIFNSLQRGATAAAKGGLFGPLGTAYANSPSMGGAVGGFLQNSAQGFKNSGVTQALDSYANPAPTQPAQMAGQVNVPAGQTMQPNGQVLGGTPAPAPAPARPVAMGQVGAPAAPAAPTPAAPAAPVAPAQPDDVQNIQNDLSTLKQSRDKQWFDTYTPEGQKTVTGAGALAGLIEGEYNDKKQTLTDELATKQAARKLASDEKQQGIDNEFKKEEMQLRREALAIEARKANQGGALSITDQIKLQEYTDAQRARVTGNLEGVNIIEQLRKYEGTPLATNILTKGLFTFVPRGAAGSTTAGKEFNALKNQLDSAIQLANAKKLSGQGQVTEFERAILRNAELISSAASPEQFYKAINNIKAELIADPSVQRAVQSASDEQILSGIK